MIRLSDKGKVRRLAQPLISALLVLAVVTGEDGDPGPAVSGVGEGNSFGVVAREAAAGERNAQSGAEDPSARLVEYMRSDRCPPGSAETDPEACAEAEGLTIPDCQGLTPKPPLWRRARPTPADPWSAWARISLWACPWDTLPALPQEDFRRLPITPSVLTVQPPRNEVFVNMPTIVYTDPAIQAFTTTLLGYPIEVEATPTRFTWDFGDGSDPIVTRSAGHPYPDHDIAYPYPLEGTYTITLTTEFTGRFRIAGTSAWLPVDGTAETTTTSDPITAVEHHTHLVGSDCYENPDGPWCDDV